jgi:hypothetical protein
VNILVFGAGVIGTIYAWQLSEAGQFEGHAAHADDEMRTIYHDVLAEGERLGVEMPHFRGFQAYVDRVAAPEATLEKKPVL